MSAINSAHQLPHHFSLTLPRLLRLLLRLVAMNIVFFVLLRFIFWFMFYEPDDSATIDTLLQAFYIGLKFDTRLALFISLPLCLVGWHKALTPFKSQQRSLLWIGYFSLAQVLVILFYAFDIGHYAYWRMHLDATSLRFLDDPLISAQMVWESYPVLWSMLGVLIASTVFIQVIRHIFNDIAQQVSLPLARHHRIWIAPLSIFIVLFGIYGKFSYYPLRWSDAYFTTNQFASALALNPVLYFFDTLKNKNSSFDIDKHVLTIGASAHTWVSNSQIVKNSILPGP